MNTIRFCCGDAIYFNSDDIAFSLIGKTKTELQQITDLEKYIPKEYIKGNNNLFDYLNNMVDSGSIHYTSQFEDSLKKFIIDKTNSLKKPEYMTSEFADDCYDYIEESLEEKCLSSYDYIDFTIKDVKESEGIYYLDFALSFDFEKDFTADITDYIDNLNELERE